MGIGVVWAAAVLSVVLRGAGDLGGEFVCEPTVAEVFPVRAGGVGVADADLLEEAAYAESGAFFQCWRGSSARVNVEDESLRDAECAGRKSAPRKADRYRSRLKPGTTGVPQRRLIAIKPGGFGDRGRWLS